MYTSFFVCFISLLFFCCRFALWLWREASSPAHCAVNLLPTWYILIFFSEVGSVARSSISIFHVSLDSRHRIVRPHIIRLPVPIHRGGIRVREDQAKQDMGFLDRSATGGRDLESFELLHAAGHLDVILEVLSCLRRGRERERVRYTESGANWTTIVHLH